MWGIKNETTKVYDLLNNISINSGSLNHFHLIYLLSDMFALSDESFQPSCLGLNKLSLLRTFVYPSREESGQNSKVSTATAKGHMDLDGPLFQRNGTKGDGALNLSVAKQTWHISEVFIVTWFSVHFFGLQMTLTQIASCRWTSTVPRTPLPNRPTVKTTASTRSPSGTTRGSLSTALLKVCTCS